MADNITIGYWASRGRAQVARHLLAYSGVKQWTQKQYEDPQQWFGKDKSGLGLSLPNLPYLFDGETKITESYAIYRYIANRFGKKELNGKDIKDAALIDGILGNLYDVDNALIALFFEPEGKTKIEGAFEKVGGKLDAIANIYGEKQFALGYLTLADFLVAELSHYFEKLSPERYAKWTYLGRVRKAVEELPEVKAYYERANAVKGPFVPVGELAF